MIEFKLIFKTSRKAVIELSGQGAYYTKPYDILLDGVKAAVSEKTVETLTGLKPDTDYRLKLVRGEETSEETVFRTDYEYVTLDVKRFHAFGDGRHDDTAAIQAAIMACPQHGRVYLPKGVYAVTSLFLKSDLTIDIGKDAVLLGTKDRSSLPILPGMTQSYDEKEDYNLGSWEGNPLNSFASMITGIHVSNVVITGEGVLEGNSAVEDWWREDRSEFEAYRPRMIFLNGCKNVTVQGLTVQNSPAWNLHPYFSEDIRFIGLTLLNPWDSPNTDGMDPESVNGLEVVGVRFSLGDDCIALKSGKYYMGHKYKMPTQNVEIRQCFMQHGHGGVSIGSEMAGGVKNVHAKDCIFQNTDRGLRIKTRRGRGKDAVVEGICFEDIRMDHVRTPFVVNCYYNCCDPDRHSDYVKSKRPLPVDGRTPEVNQLSFKNIECHNCHVAGAFLYGLPEKKISLVEFENITVDYAENPIPMEPAMMDDVDEETTLMGLYINNVGRLVTRNVRIKGSRGAAFDVHNVDEWIADGEKRCNCSADAQARACAGDRKPEGGQ